MSIRESFILRLGTEGGQKVKASLESVGKEGKKSFGVISDSAHKVTGQFLKMRTALGALGVAVSFGGLVQLSRNAFNTARELRDLSNKAGLATDKFQEMEFAARQFGVQNEALADGMKELQLRADEFAKNGVGSAAESFQRLGFTQDDVREGLKNYDEFFYKVIDRFNMIQDRAARIRILDELFGGTAGEQFLEFMGQGSEKIDKLRQQARDFGIVFDDSFVRKAVAAEDQMRNLSDFVSKNFQRGLIEGFVSEFGDFNEFMTDPEFRDSIREIGEMVAAIVRGSGDLAKFFNSARDYFAQRNQNMGQRIYNGAVNLGFAPYVSPEELAAMNNKKNVTKPDRLTLESMYGAAPNLQTFGYGATVLPTGVKKGESPTSTALDTAGNSATAAKEKVKEFRDEIVRLDATGRDADTTFADMGATFSSAFEDAIIAGNDFRDVLRGLVSDLQRMLIRKTVTDPLSSAISGFFSGSGGFSSVANTASFSSRSTASIAMSALGGAYGPGFASGGIANTPSIFGEAGPEAAVPLPDGRTIPVTLKGQSGGNNYYIDARGADQSGIADLKSMLMRLAGPGRVEERSVTAVSEQFKRNPNFGRR